MRRCACEACSVWSDAAQIQWQDGFCPFCNRFCYPVYRAGHTTQRLCMSAEARRTLHAQHGVIPASASAILEQELKSVLARHAAPLLEQAAKKWLNQFARRLFTRR